MCWFARFKWSSAFYVVDKRDYVLVINVYVVDKRGYVLVKRI